MMNGGPISWKSRRQDNVSLSTSEAEFVGASQAGQEALYLRETLKDFDYEQNTATQIYEDNLARVAMSENPVRRKFSRHIDLPQCKHKNVSIHQIHLESAPFILRNVNIRTIIS